MMGDINLRLILYYEMICFVAQSKDCGGKNKCVIGKKSVNYSLKRVYSMEGVIYTFLSYMYDEFDMFC